MAGKMTLYKLVVLGDGGVGKTALTIQVSRTSGKAQWPHRLKHRAALFESLRRDLRSDHRRFLPEASCHRFTILHVGGLRYGRTRRIHRSTGSMDPRWRRIHSSIQHHLSGLLYTHPEVPQSNTKGEGIVQCKFADWRQLPVFARFADHVHPRPACPSHASRQ